MNRERFVSANSLQVSINVGMSYRYQVAGDFHRAKVLSQRVSQIGVRCATVEFWHQGRKETIEVREADLLVHATVAGRS